MTAQPEAPPAEIARPITYARTPANLIDEGAVEGLVVDVADALAAFDAGYLETHGAGPYDLPAYYDGAARAVVRTTYPTLTEAIERDDRELSLADATRLCEKGSAIPALRGLGRVGDDAYHRADVWELVASLLRTTRNLYDDAERVRAHYSADSQRVEADYFAARQEIGYLQGVVRRIRKAVRVVSTVDDDQQVLLDALAEIKRAVRGVRTGRD